MTEKGMFTVTNRDVFPLFIAAVLISFALLALPLHGGSGNVDQNPRNKSVHASSGYESYEQFMPKERAKDNTADGLLKARSARPETVLHKKNRIYTSRRTSHKAVKYTVRKGDTLLKIAKKFKIPVASLTSANRIKNTNSIRKGMVLKIPVYGSSKTAIKEADSSSPRSSPKPGHPSFRWPVRAVIKFKQDGLNGVKPIGIIITGAPGATIFSSAPGVVKKIGRMRGFGQYIVITHSGRFTTVYSNLGHIVVTEGDTIGAGNVIGRINPDDRKLHFQIDLEGKPENPLIYLPKNNNFFY